jgi:pyruvate dehydrogenase E2 component (dihydrolipoamide acetyltransferase)
MREFTLPDVGEGVTEGELLAWQVSVGDRVTEDQVVARVETDKAAVDVPSPVDGRVHELHAEPGDVVPVGDVLVTFAVDGEDEEAAGTDSVDATDDGKATAGDGEAAADEESAPGGRVFAPPSARQLARELGVDIGAVDGSGPGGRVTEADVRAAADGQADDGQDDGGLKSAVTRIDDDENGDREADDGLTSVVSSVDDDGATGAGADGQQGGAAGGPGPAGRDRTLATPATRRVVRELDVTLDDVPAVEERDGEAYVTEAAVREYAEAQQRAQAADAAELAAGAGDQARRDGPDARERREPYRGVRKTIGEAMERSKFTAPHVTHHDTADVTELVRARERLKPRAEEQGVNLTYLPFVLKAVVAALKEHPVLNTALDEDSDEIVYKNYYDIGVATATDAGLMVPVVETVDGKGLLPVASEIADLTAAARDRSIARDQLRGSTFTVTNFGAIGGEYATPIINYPETAILGLGEIKKRPVVVERDGADGTDDPDAGGVSGEVVPRHVLTLSLSIDHRVVDGADAARFVNTLVEYLEDPTLLLLE